MLWKCMSRVWFVYSSWILACLLKIMEIIEIEVKIQIVCFDYSQLAITQYIDFNSKSILYLIEQHVVLKNVPSHSIPACWWPGISNTNRQEIPQCLAIEIIMENLLVILDFYYFHCSYSSVLNDLHNLLAILFNDLHHSSIAIQGQFPVVHKLLHSLIR